MVAISTLNVLRLLSDQAAIQHFGTSNEGFVVGASGAPFVVVVVVVGMVGIVGIDGCVGIDGIVGMVGNGGIGTACLFLRSLFVEVVVVVVVVVVDVDAVDVVVVKFGFQVESHEVVKFVGTAVEAVATKCWKPMA